jgi:hypothetical protein
MRVFPVRIKHALDVPIERPHEADPGEHRRAAKLGKKQRFHRGLNRSLQHFILEGKDGVWDGTEIS